MHHAVARIVVLAAWPAGHGGNAQQWGREGGGDATGKQKQAGRKEGRKEERGR